MAWSASKIFVSFVEDALENTAELDLNADAFKVALFNDDITPDQTVNAANSSYNGGVWTTGDEVSNGGWAAGGVSLVSPTFAPTSNVLKFDATDTANSTAATLSAVNGCLVYDDTISDRGVSYHWFGSAQSVTSGTLTIVWNASGIFTLTL